MGYYTKDGIPHINDKPATYDEGYAKSPVGKLMGDVLSAWRCPECNACLAPSGICLNACHLSAASYRRFQQGLGGFTR